MKDPRFPPMQYDLGGLMASVSAIGARGPSDLRSQKRTDTESDIEMLDTEPANLAGVTSARVGGFLDGVQAVRPIGRASGRPISLLYVAAGIVSATGDPLHIREQLQVVASTSEAELLRKDGVTVPIIEVEAEDPPTVETETVERVAGLREEMERELTAEVAGTLDGVLIVDGHLMARRRHPEVVAVAKSVSTRYLDDEASLYQLPVGWRSARFRISQKRYSAYVRLWGGRGYPWDFGLVRVETSTQDTLDSVAKAAFTYRSQPETDARWDRHLHGMVLVEAILKARRPITLIR